jgi:hypothetical protein
MVTKNKFPMKEIECVDIPTMYEMSDSEYREFLREGELGGLMYVDHHDVLRSYVADYPIATTLEQFDILIEHLKTLRRKMVPRRK